MNGDFDDVTLDQYASLGLSRGDEIDTGDLYIADKMAWPGGHATTTERVSQLLAGNSREILEAKDDCLFKGVQEIIDNYIHLVPLDWAQSWKGAYTDHEVNYAGHTHDTPKGEVKP